MTLQEFLMKLAIDITLTDEIRKLSGQSLYDKLVSMDLDSEDTQAIIDVLDKPNGSRKIRQRLAEQTKFGILADDNTNVYQVVNKQTT